MKTGPDIPQNGLVFSVDVGSIRSYTGSGTTVTDLTFAAKSNTLTNGTTVDTSNGGYLNFDGTDDRLTIPEFTLTGEWTICYWFYHDHASNPDMTIGDYNNNGSRFYHRDTGTDYKLRVHNSSHLNVQDMTLGDIRQQWGHLGYSMSSTDNTVIGWVNGAQALNISNTDNTEFVINVFSKPYADSSTYHWPGRMGPLFVYDRRLTLEEYQKIYNAHRKRFGL